MAKAKAEKAAESTESTETTEAAPVVAESTESTEVVTESTETVIETAPGNEATPAVPQEEASVAGGGFTAEVVSALPVSMVDRITAIENYLTFRDEEWRSHV